MAAAAAIAVVGDRSGGRIGMEEGVAVVFGGDGGCCVYSIHSAHRSSHSIVIVVANVVVTASICEFC